MENKMKEVAKLLGVELGEKFNIKGTNGSFFYLDDTGLYNKHGVECQYTLSMLLTGENVIEKIPFKPAPLQMYVCVEQSGRIVERFWGNVASDYYRYNAKNCFKTREEITQEDIKRIIEEMKGDYHEE